MVKLPCPETCPRCQKQTQAVQDTRLAMGFRYRRRRCTECGHRWNTYETRLNPRNLRAASAARPAVPPKTR